MVMRARYIHTGFTLLELLVAMSLMVVASACLYSSLYTGFKAKRSSERMLYPLQAAQTAIDMLEQDLRGAVVGLEDDPNFLAGPFLGINDHRDTGPDSDEITFYSTHHQINGDTDRITCGMGLITLAMIEDADVDTYHLVRQVTDNLLSQNAQEPIEEILCRNVYALNFRYFDGLRWYDEWDSTEQMDALPLAVEITLELDPWYENDQTNQSVRRTGLNRLDTDLRTRLTQVLTLPKAVPMEDVEAAAEAAEQASAGT
jgi:prepilin-type N-terminal cleavage/methylation domain-containing protein